MSVGEYKCAACGFATAIRDDDHEAELTRLRAEVERLTGHKSVWDTAMAWAHHYTKRLEEVAEASKVVVDGYNVQARGMYSRVAALTYALAALDRVAHSQTTDKLTNPPAAKPADRGAKRTGGEPSGESAPLLSTDVARLRQLLEQGPGSLPYTEGPTVGRLLDALEAQRSALEIAEGALAEWRVWASFAARDVPFEQVAVRYGQSLVDALTKAMQGAEDARATIRSALGRVKEVPEPSPDALCVCGHAYARHDGGCYANCEGGWRGCLCSVFRAAGGQG